jgi:hypothetical protein
MGQIKTYKGAIVNTNVPVGGTGIESYVICRSQGQRMILKGLDLMFNSYIAATNEWDNPVSDRFNYFLAELNAAGQVNPFQPTELTITKGTAQVDRSIVLNTVGHYDFNLAFQGNIFLYVWTYNYAAAGARRHLFEVLFTVEEFPLNQ